MMRRLALLAGFWFGLLGGAQAALVTEVFTITLPEAQAHYDLGHVFRITATYDTAGTLVHQWLDGPNQRAEFGAGDDAIEFSVAAADVGYVLNTDAQILVSGLLNPSGLVDRDAWSSNYSFVRDSDSPGHYRLAFRADVLDVSLHYFVPSDEYLFSLTQFWRDPETRVASQTTIGGIYTSRFVTRQVLTVPEPGSLALLALGVAGIRLAARRVKA